MKKSVKEFLTGEYIALKKDLKAYFEKIENHKLDYLYIIMYSKRSILLVLKEMWKLP